MFKALVLGAAAASAAKPTYDKLSTSYDYQVRSDPCRAAPRSPRAPNHVSLPAARRPSSIPQAWLADFGAEGMPSDAGAYAANLKQILAHNADTTQTWKAGVNKVR